VGKACDETPKNGVKRVFSATNHTNL
jgi:hypothetical protein